MNKDIPMGVMAGWMTAILFIGIVSARIVCKALVNVPTHPQEMPAKGAEGIELCPQLVQTVKLPNGKFIYTVKQK